MLRLEEEKNGLETTFHLSVPITQAEQMRRHLESLVELIGNVEEERNFFNTTDELLPGPALKRLRQKHKMTQKGLADALGITQARVSDLEQGIRPITPEQAQKCAELFGVSAKSFLV